jgi:DNA-binding NarL/FixJ family response regulator
MITIVLVDDQPAVRLGLRMRLALEPDLTVTGEAGDGAAVPALVRGLHPDVVVMDIEMPGMDGIAATAALQHLVPGSPVVILSLHDDPVTRRRALASGASAFVSKCDAHELLPAMIRRAVQGKSDRSASPPPA